MKEIKNWEARRSGGRITVNGRDAQTGDAVKVANVDAIEPLNGKLIATDKHGAEHVLLVA